MLFLLTGDIQIGKTRWLQDLCLRLQDAGIEPCGVVAPGTWIPHEDGLFEKTGIDNLLLPQSTLVPFARRRDLAKQEGSFHAGSQSARANLGWEIDDEAISTVNLHFRKLGSARDCQRKLLIADELGRLELCRSQGLTEAVALLDKGPGKPFPFALAVVRDTLLHLAMERFSQWEAVAIGPDDASRDLVMAAILNRPTP